MPEIVERLEQALRIWEDFCYLVSLVLKFQLATGQKPFLPHCGPFVHSQELRQYLLNAYQRPMDDEDFLRRFVGPLSIGGPDGLGDLHRFPHLLARWNSQSRRVYHLGADIQCIFNATKISNIRWKEILLPFEAFAITLDLPIIGTTFKQDYDCILVSSSISDLGVPIIEFRLLPTKFKDYTPIPQEQKNLLQSWLKAKKWHKLKPKILKFMDLVGTPIILPSFAINLPEEAQNCLVTESIIAMRQQYIESLEARGIKAQAAYDFVSMEPEGNAGTRFLVSLCLFLSSYVRPEAERGGKRAQQPGRGNGSQAIHTCADINQVKFTQRLSQAEVEVFSSGLRLPDGRAGGSHGEISTTHWRRGIWRFRPNQRLVTGASKSVKVKPCLVRPDLLKPGEVPPGNKTEIS